MIAFANQNYEVLVSGRLYNLLDSHVGSALRLIPGLELRLKTNLIPTYQLFHIRCTYVYIALYSL